MIALQGTLAVLGRLALCAIFLTSAVANKILNFSGTAQYMASKGMPLPELMLVGAIVFLIAGSLSLILGYHARVGAVLLLVFLLLATWYFHDFWNLDDPAQARSQQIQFMKNLALMGAMLIIATNGIGIASLDARRTREKRS